MFYPEFRTLMAHLNFLSFYQLEHISHITHFSIFQPEYWLKNPLPRVFFTENKAIYPIEMRQNMFSHPVFTDNDGKCEIMEALHDEIFL